jgi:hypothetical protein
MEIDWMRIALEKLDPVDNCDPPEPWYKQDPWEALDPLYETEEEEPPGMPMTIGPASGGPAGPASGVDLQSGRMAAELHWEVRKQSAESK